MLSIDVGYGNTKIYDGENAAMFPSIYYDCTNESIRKEEMDEAMLLELPEGKFLVGTTALKKGGQPLFNKTDVFRHKLFILTAICVSSKKEFNDDIVLGLPINDMPIMQAHLEALKGSYTVKYNGVEKKITIKSVQVFAQSESIYSVLKTYDKNIDKKTIGIIDVGQKTVDMAWFEENTLVTKQTFSIDNAGVLSAYEEIIKKVNAITGAGLQAVQCRKYIKKLGDEIKPDVDSAFANLTDTIVKACDSHGWAWKLLDTIYVVGGGAEHVAKALTAKGLKPTTAEQSVFANVYSFYMRSER